MVIKKLNANKLSSHSTDYYIPDATASKQNVKHSLDKSMDSANYKRFLKQHHNDYDPTDVGLVHQSIGKPRKESKSPK